MRGSTCRTRVRNVGYLIIVFKLYGNGLFDKNAKKIWNRLRNLNKIQFPNDLQGIWNIYIKCRQSVIKCLCTVVKFRRMIFKSIKIKNKLGKVLSQRLIICYTKFEKDVVNSCTPKNKNRTKPK